MEEGEKTLIQTQKWPHYWGTTPEQDYYDSQGIKSSKAFFTTPRGLKLFTRQWLPLLSPPRGLIFMIHGYGNDISWTFQATAIFLAFVPDVDCRFFFSFVRQTPDFRALPSFLYGESMGGAICLFIHFDGAILVAPMCKISDDVKPKWPIPQILTLVAKFLPTLANVPTGDLMVKSVKVEEKKVIADINPCRYRGKPRLGTVVELLRVTDYVSQRLCNVSLPFNVLHGSADVVTDPNVSRALYEEAKSEDILAWLNQRWD